MASQSTGQRIFAVTSLILSALVLLIAVGVIIGAWVARRPAIDAVNGSVQSVEQFAHTGQAGISRLDGRLDDMRTVVDEVGTAADRAAQNVADQGLMTTLLPPETEQRLRTAAQQVTDTLAGIADIVRAVMDLAETINKLPFVSLPKVDPERVSNLENQIEAARTGAEQLQSNIPQFRDGAASSISTLSTTAASVDERLVTAQNDLAQLDSRLEQVIADAHRLGQQVNTGITVSAVVVTLLFGWTAYAMVVLILQSWAKLRASQDQS